MSFYSDASLVLIPSGYKDQKVYCAVPTDGSGDLTFSRASNATRVASNGLIEKVRTNLLLQSNTFDTTWTQQNTTLTSGQAGYDGSNDAWKVEAATTATTRLYQSSSIAANTLITISLYAKVGNVDFIRFNFLTSGTNSSVIFDLTDGTTYSSTAIDTTWESVGSGWVRIAATFVNIDAITESRIEVRSDYTTLSCAAGSFVYIQDAQLETGDIATDYIATTSAAVSVGPVSGLPRLDYLNSSCPRLLLEPQRTNLFTFSEQINNADWVKFNSTISANGETSLDGYDDADKVVENSSAAEHGFYQLRTGSVGASATYVISVFAKYDGRNLQLKNSYTNDASNFNLQNGTVISNISAGVGEIVDYGNGWYRCSLKTTADGSGNAGLTAYLLNDSNSISYTGNGTSGVFVWGAQLEAGAYATSYIPTLSTSVTRVAESASKTGISSLIGQTEGTLFFEGVFGNEAEEMYLFLQNEASSSVENSIYLQKTSSSILLRVWNAASLDVSISGGTFSVGQSIKIAAAYKLNDFVLYVNGVQIGTDTSGAVPLCGRLQLGSFYADPVNNIYIARQANQALLFKTRLTNESLEALTSL